MTTKILSNFITTYGASTKSNVATKKNTYSQRKLNNDISPNSGGTIVYSNGYVYHVFKQSDVFVWNDDGQQIDVLLVGGGGGGGQSVYGGAPGGGAGGTQYITGRNLKKGRYAVSVGAGGSAMSSGADSTFLDYIGYGGGAGGTANFGLSYSGLPLTGGSSGGGANHGGANSANLSYITQPNEDVTGNWTATSYPWITTMWSPLTNQKQPRSRYGGLGNKGGAANNGGWRITTNTWVLFRSGSAGGGGAGGAGANALYNTGTKTTTTGAGGVGTSTYSSLLMDIDSLDIGENVSGTRYIAAGGGGGLHEYSVNVFANGNISGIFGTIPAASLGGGGRGGQVFFIDTTSGKTNSGSGGGGGSGSSMSSGSGGSGVVIIRYPQKVY